VNGYYLRQEQAKERLRAVIGRELYLDLINKDECEITAPSGRRYRIESGHTVGNVKMLDPAYKPGLYRRGDDVMQVYCCAPKDWDEVTNLGLSWPDAVAAQYLAIMTDERGFLRTANHWTPGYRTSGIKHTKPPRVGPLHRDLQSFTNKMPSTAIMLTFVGLWLGLIAFIIWVFR
jgi:hypothetical protein